MNAAYPSITRFPTVFASALHYVFATVEKMQHGCKLGKSVGEQVRIAVSGQRQVYCIPLLVPRPDEGLFNLVT
jgi:hypothetical protein